MTLYGTDWSITLNELGLVTLFAGLLFVIGAIVIILPLWGVLTFLLMSTLYIVLFFWFRMSVFQTPEQVDLAVIVIVLLAMILGYHWRKYDKDMKKEKH